MDGKELRKYRLSLGISQAKFAKALGIVFETYREWEYGRRRMTSAIRSYLLHTKECPIFKKKIRKIKTKK
jgi:DNA-binding transcriptional regulator YiaG